MKGWEVVSAAFAIVATAAVVGLLVCILQIEGYKTELQSVTRHVTDLEEQVKLLEGDVLRHDDIMVTYQFFNEHWTKEMKGE